MNHLIDVGVCALAGCTNFIILHNYFNSPATKWSFFDGPGNRV